jgi:serine/threonine protein kinase
MIGQTILHYKILKELGRGGMGVVYLAEDTKLKRQVAIKFLPQYISSDQEQKKRFELEAQAAASLNHPNITTIYAIEESGSEVFIVMEYIDGIELKDKIKSGPISVEEAINIAIQIAEGLEAAHRKGIVHRDIKSQNIMITGDGKVKIMDFGIAKVGEGTQLTKVGSTIGTAAYMSPEQTKGEEVDQRTDIWSLGIILYEMVTGKLPFSGGYDQAIIYSILNEEPEPVTEIDAGLLHILNRTLAKNPDDRYHTAGEIESELRTIREGGSIKRVVKQPNLPWIIAGAMLILFLAVLYFFMHSSNSVEEQDKNEIKTIAVLPFVNMSSDPDQEYLSDGLSEELINVLSRNPKLGVIARTSSFSFKGKGLDIKSIAAKLNVKNILEGSVRKSGNNLRITADLVNVETDATLWSNTYDGTLGNIFALQDSISGSVAEALKAVLLGKDVAAPEQKTNPEAYNYYLLGKHFYDLRGKENLERAADYYKKALSIDSSYAPAWVGLSIVHSRQADKTYVPVDEGYAMSRQEVEKALELNPNLASAYASMGWIKWAYDWDWTGADEAFTRALELEPGNAVVISNASVLAFTLGRFDEAIKLDHRSIELDPVRVATYSNLGLHNWYARLPDESQTAFRKCLELNPKFPGAHMYIGLVYLEEGKPDSALIEMQKESELFWQTYGLTIVYHALGKNKKADNKLAELIKKWQNYGAFQIAEIYAYFDKKDKAFEWLERAYKQRDGGFTQMLGDPLLHKIEKDPRYTAFMKKMKLPL